jgi:hypothetical protein
MRDIEHIRGATDRPFPCESRSEAEVKHAGKAPPSHDGEAGALDRTKSKKSGRTFFIMPTGASYPTHTKA